MMMQRMRISRKASKSSQSLSVSKALNNLPTETTLIRITELELDEEGTRISLTVVDTPGFGDQIDNEARYALIRDNILIRVTDHGIASARLLAISSDSTMTFLRRSRALSVTHDSATIVFMLFSTLLLLQDTGMHPVI